MLQEFIQSMTVQQKELQKKIDRAVIGNKWGLAQRLLDQMDELKGELGNARMELAYSEIVALGGGK